MKKKVYGFFRNLEMCIQYCIELYALCVREMLLQAAYSIEIILVDFRCRYSQDAISI